MTVEQSASARGADPLDADVAVVGFGPVGAVLTALLGRLGVSAIVLDRTTEAHDLPRATYFDREIMRVFQAAGYAEQVGEVVVSNRRYLFNSAEGELLRAFDHIEGPTPWGMETGFNFFQPQFEGFLREGAHLPSTEVRLGVEVRSVEEEDDAVRLDLAGGESLRVGWVVGCDGGASTVRRAAGIELEDLDFDEPWIVLDAFANRDLGLPERDVVQRCDPARPSTYIPSVGRHRRWEFMLMPGEDPDERVSAEGIAELLAGWGVGPGDVEVVRSAVFRFHALLASPWRRGRVLLAGDAAHQMPPFFGQGMCAGIRDAANLAWKLERVVAGASRPELSSTPTRRSAPPHVREIIELSTELGRIVCTTDPAIAAERDARMRAESAEKSEEGGHPDPLEFIPDLQAGVLHRAADGVAAMRAGEQFIQPRVRPAGGEPMLLDEAIGGGFRLIGLGRDPLAAVADDVAAWWGGCGSTAVVVDSAPAEPPSNDRPTVTDEDGFLREWFAESEGRRRRRATRQLRLRRRARPGSDRNLAGRPTRPATTPRRSARRRSNRHGEDGNPMSTHMNHVALRVTDLDAATERLVSALGLRETARDSGVALLTANAKHHEVQLISAAEPGLDHVAIEVDSLAELEALRGRVEAAGAPIVATEPLEDGVAEAFRLQAPADLVIEVVCGMTRSPASVSDLLAGHARRFGHVTMQSPDRLELIDFLTSAIGFEISDQVFDMTWMRCDTDHHGLAVGGVGEVNRMHHYAFELAGWNGMIRYLDDLALVESEPIWGPGRHGPGNNLYTYLPDTDGALIEAYADLERIDGPNLAPRPRLRSASRPDGPLGGTPPEGFLDYGIPILAADLSMAER